MPEPKRSSEETHRNAMQQVWAAYGNHNSKKEKKIIKHISKKNKIIKHINSLASIHEN